MSRRLASGGAIDRARPISFSFDGRVYSGYAGDTLASALLGAGVAVVGRSFKTHRPRGVRGHWVEEPNAFFDLTRDGRREPNARATTTFLEAGVALSARSINAAPNAERDVFAFLDLFSRFMPSGFYYKTFLWPNWRMFEPAIRAMAGLGRIDPQWKPAAPAAARNRRCEVLVIGAGPAGLAAARAAAEAGMGVLVVDDRPAPGGSLLFRGGAPDGGDASAWIAETVAAIEAAGGAVLANATAYGVYDHNLVCALQRGGAAGADTLWRIRPRHIVLAAGAIERPLLFDANDRPGILSAEAGLAYLRQYGVLIGERVVVAANNDSAYPVAAALREAGAAVTIVDGRETSAGIAAAAAAGIDVRRGERVAARRGPRLRARRAPRRRGDDRGGRAAGLRRLRPDRPALLPGQGPHGLGRAAARLRSRRRGGRADRRRRGQRRVLARRRAGARTRRDRRAARRRRREERAQPTRRRARRRARLAGRARRAGGRGSICRAT